MPCTDCSINRKDGRLQHCLSPAVFTVVQNGCGYMASLPISLACKTCQCHRLMRAQSIKSICTTATQDAVMLRLVETGLNNKASNLPGKGRSMQIPAAGFGVWCTAEVPRYSKYI